MFSQTFTHIAGILATAILVSIRTAGAAIAASGLGHALAGRPTAACATAGCGPSPYQTKPAHLAKASASIAMRGVRGR